MMISIKEEAMQQYKCNVNKTIIVKKSKITPMLD